MRDFDSLLREMEIVKELARTRILSSVYPLSKILSPSIISFVLNRLLTFYAVFMDTPLFLCTINKAIKCILI